MSRLKIPKPRGCQSLIVHDLGATLELTLLTVRRDRRGLGIGSEAIERVKSVAARLGKAVELRVDRPKRVSLMRFYAKRGFVSAGGLEMIWRPQT